MAPIKIRRLLISDNHLHCHTPLQQLIDTPKEVVNHTSTSLAGKNSSPNTQGIRKGNSKVDITAMATLSNHDSR